MTPSPGIPTRSLFRSTAAPLIGIGIVAIAFGIVCVVLAAPLAAQDGILVNGERVTQCSYYMTPGGSSVMTGTC